MTIPSRIAAALRRKYATPREVLRALGLDENLVPETAAAKPSEPVNAIRDDEKLQKFRALLRAAGLSTEDIDHAGALATNSSGKTTADRMPSAAIGGLRHAMDAASVAAKLDHQFGVGRIAVEASDRRAGARPVMGPDRAAVGRLNARFLGIERIGHV